MYKLKTKLYNKKTSYCLLCIYSINLNIYSYIILILYTLRITNKGLKKFNINIPYFYTVFFIVFSLNAGSIFEFKHYLYNIT